MRRQVVSFFQIFREGILDFLARPSFILEIFLSNKSKQSYHLRSCCFLIKVGDKLVNKLSFANICEHSLTIGVDTFTNPNEVC